MFRGWKRLRLKRAYLKVQSYATQKKVWGNNLSTLVVMNKIVNDYFGSLFDVELFVTKSKNSIIQSAFPNMLEMVQWLNGVRLVCKEAANGTKVEFSGPNAALNIAKQHDVNFNEYLEKGGYPINIIETFGNMTRIINEISGYLAVLEDNQRQYFDLRLSTGLNTLLVFHELILEVMINE